VQRQTYGYLSSRRTSLPCDWYHQIIQRHVSVCEQLAHSRYLAVGVELATVLESQASALTIKLEFHGTDTDIFARIVARMSACRPFSLPQE